MELVFFELLNWVGSVGFLIILALGAPALNAAKEKKKVLPSIFKILILLVCVSHFKFQYFNYFDLNNPVEYCRDNHENIVTCSLGTVKKVKPQSSKLHIDGEIVFNDHNGDLRSFPIEMVGNERYLNLKEGDEVLVGYNVDYYGALTSHQFKRKRRFWFVDWVFFWFSASVFIIGIFFLVRLEKALSKPFTTHLETA